MDCFHVTRRRSMKLGSSTASNLQRPTAMQNAARQTDLETTFSHESTGQGRDERGQEDEGRRVTIATANKCGIILGKEKQTRPSQARKSVPRLNSGRRAKVVSPSYPSIEKQSPFPFTPTPPHHRDSLPSQTGRRPSH